MVVLRHLVGSDPNIQISDEESTLGSAVTVHFDARVPKAARRIDPEGQSVVVAEPGRTLNVVVETTHVTRLRGVARWLSPNQWVITFENHWVFVAVGFCLVALLVCVARLRGH